MMDSPSTGAPPPESIGAISVPVAIVLGLIASFIQSLGLTIQRKSHLQNESLPVQQRRTEWKRPLWLVGFVIFITANLSGTIFQIGALPIVMLAPLGAVSLLYNALLARILLNDIFSHYMIIGTLLISVGAVMIGYFGTVPDHPHTLDELLILFARPTFVAFAATFTFAFLGVLAIAHLAEWQLELRIARKALGSKPKSRKSRKDMKRRWSAPTLATLTEVNENPSGIATPILAIADEAARIGLPADRLVAAARENGLIPAASSTNSKQASQQQQQSARAPLQIHTQKDYGSITRNANPSDYSPPRKSSGSKSSEASKSKKKQREAEQLKAEEAAISRTRLGLGIAFGGVSGTLSGTTLIFAKSGVELLVLSFTGHNQFSRWQSWFLVGIMIIGALAQLWYLNKSLRLSDPTVVCPLAFCFYNTSSIAFGLVYFNQIGALKWWELLLVAIGTILLLTGVWIVSLHRKPDTDEDELDSCMSSPEQSMVATPDMTTGEPDWASPFSTPPSPGRSEHRRRRSPSLTLGINTLSGVEPDEEEPHTASALYSTFLERGFSVGIAASSPGFHLKSTQNQTARESRPGGSRRTMSEADMSPFHPTAEDADADVNAIDRLESGGGRRARRKRALPGSDTVEEGDEEPMLEPAAINSSAFHLDHLPTLDVASLRQRLAQHMQLDTTWVSRLLRQRERPAGDEEEPLISSPHD